MHYSSFLDILWIEVKRNSTAPAVAVETAGTMLTVMNRENSGQLLRKMSYALTYQTF